MSPRPIHSIDSYWIRCSAGSESAQRRALVDVVEEFLDRHHAGWHSTARAPGGPSPALVLDVAEFIENVDSGSERTFSISIIRKAMAAILDRSGGDRSPNTPHRRE